MLKKIVLSVGCVLIVSSVVLAVYAGIQLLGVPFFSFEDVFKIIVIIGFPMLIGIVLVTSSVPNEIRRKIIIIEELVFLFMYGFIVFELVFGGFRISAFGLETNLSVIDYIKLNCNFVPFKTIFYYVSCFFSGEINRGIVINNLVGNFMMFMPAGLLLPAIFTKQRKWVCFLITIASILIGIEVVQLVFRLGTFDIDDFILGMTGACLVYGIIRIGVIKRFLNWAKIF